MTRLPNFIGIGAPKCGTTWLANCLRQHPDIYLPPAKELVFFDYGDFDQRLDDYLEHFDGVAGERAIGEFTTRYLASERPAPRIREMIPETKLIVCLRNPVEQIYSHYWHLLRQNFHQAEPQPALSFEQALERFTWKLKEPARYWKQLQFWLKHFDRQQFLVLLFEDIKEHPESTLRTTYEFLGVDRDFVPKSVSDTGASARKGTSPRSMAAGVAHKHVYSLLSNHIYRPVKQVIGVRRADQIKESLRVRRILETLFFRRGYPKMSDGTCQQLKSEFAGEVAGIEEYTGRSLDAWR